MLLRQGTATASILSLVALAAGACGSSASVPAYSVCTPNDTCPSLTVCESESATSGAFCTWSCESDSDCPPDSLGNSGICTSVEGSYPQFCYHTCTGGCPVNEGCTAMGEVSVCVPFATPNTDGGGPDPLSGTVWLSTTVTSTAAADGVLASVYTITFGAATSSTSTGGMGPFTATLDIQYGNSGTNAGCSEQTRINGGTWSDDASARTFSIGGSISSTTRSGCSTSSSNVSNSMGLYNGEINGGSESYVITGTSMTLTGDSGVPYDGQSFTFTSD